MYWFHGTSNKYVREIEEAAISIYSLGKWPAY
jgi:hypothetical protein